VFIVADVGSSASVVGELIRVKVELGNASMELDEAKKELRGYHKAKEAREARLREQQMMQQGGGQ
jgi:hypothetical protein